jgi:hypothetical protein
MTVVLLHLPPSFFASTNDRFVGFSVSFADNKGNATRCSLVRIYGKSDETSGGKILGILRLQRNQASSKRENSNI